MRFNAFEAYCMTENYTRRRNIYFSRKGIRRVCILSRPMWLFWRIIWEGQLPEICFGTAVCPLKCVFFYMGSLVGERAYDDAP